MNRTPWWIALGFVAGLALNAWARPGLPVMGAPAKSPPASAAPLAAVVGLTPGQQVQIAIPWTTGTPPPTRLTPGCYVGPDPAASANAWVQYQDPSTITDPISGNTYLIFHVTAQSCAGVASVKGVAGSPGAITVQASSGTGPGCGAQQVPVVQIGSDPCKEIPTSTQPTGGGPLPAVTRP